MSGNVYRINKAINRPVVVKGLKAQYIWWMGGGLVALLLLFAILYVVGVSVYACVGSILVMGVGWVWVVYRLSNTYGEHGMMKASARKRLPEVVKGGGRKVFIK